MRIALVGMAVTAFAIVLASAPTHACECQGPQLTLLSPAVGAMDVGTDVPLFFIYAHQGLADASPRVVVSIGGTAVTGSLQVLHEEESARGIAVFTPSTLRRLSERARARIRAG